MPGTIRSNIKAMKIAYKILKVAKDRQQDPQKKPSDKLIKEWFRDSSMSQ